MADIPREEELRIRREERARCAAAVDFIATQVEENSLPGPVRSAAVSAIRTTANALRTLQDIDLGEPDMTNVVQLPVSR